MANEEDFEFLASKQDFYPAQPYNTPAILDFASAIDLNIKKLMDLGCGDGQLIRYLHLRNSSIQFSGLTTPGTSKQINSLGFQIKEGDMHLLPWENETFDAVTARHVLEHSISPLISLQEINRVLVPGGFLYMVVPDPNSEWIALWQDHYSVLTYNNWRKLIQDSGFEIENFVESTWLASHSMKNEIEYRFKLKKAGSNIIPIKVKSSIDGHLMAKSKLEFQGTHRINLVVVLHNLVLFYQLEEMLKPYKDKCIIIIPSIQGEGWKNMCSDTYDFLISKNWNVKHSSELENIVECDIALYPYLYPVELPIHSNWSGRYLYGLAKDEWNLSLENNLPFDFIFTYGPIEDSFLATLSKTIPIGNMQNLKTRNKPSINNGKKTILYLPTYGELSSISQSHIILKNLARDYNVIIKLHHGNSFLDLNTVSDLNKLSYKVFDHQTLLSELLTEVDVVLADVSGAIYQAVAAEVPVVVLEVHMNRKTDIVQKFLQENGFITSTMRHEEIEELLKTVISQDNQRLKEASRAIFWANGDAAIQNAQRFLSELLDSKNQNLINELEWRREVKNQMLNNFNEGFSAKRVSEELSKSYLDQNTKILSDYQSIKSELDEKISESETLAGKLSDSMRKSLEIEAAYQTLREEIEKKDQVMARYQFNTKTLSLQIDTFEKELSEMKAAVTRYESSNLFRFLDFLKKFFRV